MIIVTLVICAILAFYFYVYLSNRVVANTLTILAVAGVVASIFFIVKNDHDHYGMHNVTETKTQRIYSASPSKNLPMMLYQSIGTADKHRVYVYKTSASAKKTNHTRAKVTTSNTVKRTTGHNRIVTIKTYREYKNSTAKFWFGLADNGHQYVKEHNIIYINKNWTVLSAPQAKKLQKLASSKSYQAKQKAAATAYVKKAVMAAMMKNPSMTAAQQKQITQQAAAAYQAQAMQQLIKQVKAE
ncbi:DUF4811 domain-containing protein [Levilactobacillus brevis]|uniref:DUF4811 domain-containing protein n=1 Tax=Levilactobacillus brevis TaxID=1580 RepID=UPI000A2FD1E9|nr:DUF4811 domain-containing protein [Levilactobacillus brevis]ARQ92397.1 hypothetical protein A6F60_01230 [Levilactobacillus brevis]MBU7538918.1 DUF4811 domain-containing protein [Levilactobacillus brevis]MBU7560139.1 DUF4811 domain-containing protein [Levilactobacillus brevis]MBU7565091.1 DUF4811 domain-containing protein [Levilactobacillus brevis]MCE6011716.1 DUF4811 domain-containing protein [Levilactobacillus brevis]